MMDKLSGSSWREQTDPLTGSTFFYNNITLQSQWERPADLAVLGSSAGDIPGQSQSTTDMPSSQQLETAPGGVGWMAMTSTLLRAKRAWRALVDNSTGSTYYFDETTGVSQWEKPSEIDDNGVSHSPDRVTTTVVEQHNAAESNSGTTTPHLGEGSLATAVTTPNSTHIIETRLEGRRGSEESSSVAGNATLADKPAGNCGGDRDPGRQRIIADALHIDVDSSRENILFTEGGSTPSCNDGTVTNVGESSQYGSAQRLGSVRPGSAHGNPRQQNSGRGEQKDLLEYPETIFTAWRTPNSEEHDGFEGCIEPKDVELESEFDHGRRAGAGGDVPTRSEVNNDSLSYLPSSRQEGGMGSAQLTMHEGEGEGEDKNEDKATEHRINGGSRYEQQVNRDMAGSGEGGRTSARDGPLAMGDIFDRRDKRHVAAVGSGNRPSSSPLHSTPRSDGEHQQNANPDDASVSSVESGSTLSTYTGGLDSLAQYVTGHSSTLDRGAVLELPITRAKYEDGPDGDGNTRTTDSSLEGKQSSPGGLTTSMAEKSSSEKTPRSVNEENQPTVMAQPVQSNSNSGIIFSAQTAGHEQSTISWSENEEGAEKLVDKSPACPVDGTDRIAPRSSSALDGAREGGRQAVMNTPVSTLPAGVFESDDDKSVPQQSRREACTGSRNSTHTSANEQQANSLPRKEDDAHRMGELSSGTRRHRVDNPSAVASPFPALQGDTGAVTSEQLPRALQEASSKGSKVTNSIVDDVKGCDTNSAATAAVRSQDPRKGTLNAVIPTTESSVVPPGMTAGVHSTAAPCISRYDTKPAGRMTTAVAGVMNGPYASESCAVEGSDPQPFDAVHDAAGFKAAVKLQAHTRGWAARQLCARIVARRETMAREMREAQQRAATAIQSAARGHLERREQRKAREIGSLSDQYNAGYTYVQARGATVDANVVGAETPSVSFLSEQRKQRLMRTMVSVQGNDGEVKSRAASQALSVFRVDGSDGPGTRSPIDGTGGSISESHIAVENSYRRNYGGRDNEDGPITTSDRSQGVLQGEQRSHDSEQCAEGHDWMLNVEHGWIATMSRLKSINEEEDSQTQQQDEYRFWNRENAEEGSPNKWKDNGKEAVLYTEVPTTGSTGVEHPAGADDTCVEEDWAGYTEEATEAYPKYCHDLSNSSEDVGNSSDLTSPDNTSESVDGRSHETSTVSDLDHQSDVNLHDIETEKGYVQHRAEVNRLEGRGDGMWEVDRDTTAPLETLEDLRTNVAGQAEVVARITMTATGTDASRCEATRIRYVKISEMR